MIMNQIPHTNIPITQPVIPSNKLPRIAICGLKPNQIQEISKACKHYAHLRFFSKDVTMPAFSSNDDYTVLFTNFIGHDIQNQAVQLIGKEKLIRHSGGISTGIALIQNLSKTFKP